MNYCIGTLGWLSGPAFQPRNGTANVSLYDQSLALDWIQEHIHRFGDGPNGVTVTPDHGVRRWKERCTVPASLPQSPGFDLSESNLNHEELYSTLLRKGNATSLADPRTASSTNLIAAN